MNPEKEEVMELDPMIEGVPENIYEKEMIFEVQFHPSLNVIGVGLITGEVKLFFSLVQIFPHDFFLDTNMTWMKIHCFMKIKFTLALFAVLFFPKMENVSFFFSFPSHIFS